MDRRQPEIKEDTASPFLPGCSHGSPCPPTQSLGPGCPLPLLTQIYSEASLAATALGIPELSPEPACPSWHASYSFSCKLEKKMQVSPSQGTARFNVTEFQKQSGEMRAVLS